MSKLHQDHSLDSQLLNSMKPFALQMLLQLHGKVVRGTLLLSVLAGHVQSLAGLDEDPELAACFGELEKESSLVYGVDVVHASVC